MIETHHVLPASTASYRPSSARNLEVAMLTMENVLALPALVGMTARSPSAVHWPWARTELLELRRIVNA